MKLRKGSLIVTVKTSDGVSGAAGWKEDHPPPGAVVPAPVRGQVPAAAAREAVRAAGAPVVDREVAAQGVAAPVAVAAAARAAGALVVDQGVAAQEAGVPVDDKCCHENTIRS